MTAYGSTPALPKPAMPGAVGVMAVTTCAWSASWATIADARAVAIPGFMYFEPCGMRPETAWIGLIVANGRR